MSVYETFSTSRNGCLHGCIPLPSFLSPLLHLLVQVKCAVASFLGERHFFCVFLCLMIYALKHSIFNNGGSRVSMQTPCKVREARIIEGRASLWVFIYRPDRHFAVARGIFVRENPFLAMMKWGIVLLPSRPKKEMCVCWEEGGG